MDSTQRTAYTGTLSHTFLCAMLALLFASPAHAWWNGDWTLRKKITLDTSGTGASIGGPIGTVPVLVRLYDGNFRFGSAKPDASDLRFVAEDDKTLLSYHIEKYDPLLNEAFVWVKVPEVKPGAKNTIWFYYGNLGNKAIKVEDTKGTYDESTELVYHFSEHGQPAYDFTASGNNASGTGVPSDSAIIGTGLRLDGKTTLTIPAGPAIEWSNGGFLTWSAWIKYVAPQANGILFSRRSNGRAFVVGVDNGAPYVEVRSGGVTQRTSAGASLVPGTWRHLGVIADGSRISLYLDGEAYGSVAAALPGLDGPSIIGGDSIGGAGFVGEMDELEISKVARPPGALKLAAVGQGPDGAAKFISFGEDEQQTSWLSFIKTGYIGVIIGSLSVDGWVVIGILGVMFVVSVSVMVAKASYLNRISKGNEQFLKEWSQLANDLSVLENVGAEPSEDPSKVKGSAMPLMAKRTRNSAPLYHIYHIGVAEIQHRLAADRAGGSAAPLGAKALSARSIQAIRATLDAGLTRETQKLNDKMVLLTIAISGGPFLGLLGTVVGVMITFAAVAQAGDVNVNAIAPGIAAALAATVAGLGVAIPSLFGYNYLLTRIKAASTDMHVFIDEFVTKMAEFYSQGEG